MYVIIIVFIQEYIHVHDDLRLDYDSNPNRKISNWHVLEKKNVDKDFLYLLR